MQKQKQTNPKSLNLQVHVTIHRCSVMKHKRYTMVPGTTIIVIILCDIILYGCGQLAGGGGEVFFLVSKYSHLSRSNCLYVIYTHVAKVEPPVKNQFQSINSPPWKVSTTKWQKSMLREQQHAPCRLS